MTDRTLEDIYDKEMAPLITKLIEISHNNGIPLVISVCLDPNLEDGDLHCTTLINDTVRCETLQSAARAILNQKSSPLMAITVQPNKADH